MDLWQTIKSYSPFSTEKITSSVQAQPPKTELVYKPTLWDSIFTSAPAAWLEKKLTPANEAIEKTGGIVATIGSVNTGVKWGLILGGVVLALFLIAEYRALVPIARK